MNLIAHRRNTIEELQTTPSEYGVEVDIRSDNGQLIIQHDPFADGEKFDEWIKYYHHGTLILNVKEEGLESRLISLMMLYGIKDYFFLDQSFPFLIKWSKLGERRCAVRISEYESVQTALTLKGKIDWVWVDSFAKLSLDGEDARHLQDAGFKLCLVSPELQDRPAETSIPELAELLAERQIVVDAICSKKPEIWKEYF
jgi:hypothetical protein